MDLVTGRDIGIAGVSNILSESRISPTLIVKFWVTFQARRKLDLDEITLKKRAVLCRISTTLQTRREQPWSNVFSGHPNNMLDLLGMFYLDIYWRKIAECTYLLQPWNRSYKPHVSLTCYFISQREYYLATDTSKAFTTPYASHS
jgi:hypothetical protein